jgi:hypothetical protein
MSWPKSNTPSTPPLPPARKPTGVSRPMALRSWISMPPHSSTSMSMAPTR